MFFERFFVTKGQLKKSFFRKEIYTTDIVAKVIKYRFICYAAKFLSMKREYGEFVVGGIRPIKGLLVNVVDVFFQLKKLKRHQD
jgi:hypothetical protein